MASDKTYYAVEGLSYEEVVERLDNAREMLTFVQKTETMATYDCNWVEGAYINIAESNGATRIELDGTDIGILGAESLLEEILGRELVEVQ